MKKVLKIFIGVSYNIGKSLPFLNTVASKCETAFEALCWHDNSGRGEGESL